MSAACQQCRLLSRAARESTTGRRKHLEVKGCWLWVRGIIVWKKSSEIVFVKEFWGLSNHESLPLSVLNNRDAFNRQCNLLTMASCLHSTTYNSWVTCLRSFSSWVRSPAGPEMCMNNINVFLGFRMFYSYLCTFIHSYRYAHVNCTNNNTSFAYFGIGSSDIKSAAYI